MSGAFTSGLNSAEFIQAFEGVFPTHWCCVIMRGALMYSELVLFRVKGKHSGVRCDPHISELKLLGCLLMFLCKSECFSFVFSSVWIFWIIMVLEWLSLGAL